MIARIAATARTIPKTYASLAGSGFGAMCPLLATRQMSPCRTLEGLNGKMCERLHTSLVVQKMQGDLELAIIWVRATLGTEEGPSRVAAGASWQNGSK